MMFEAVAFKFCPIHIKLSTSNFKLKKGLSSCDKPFFIYLSCHLRQSRYDWRSRLPGFGWGRSRSCLCRR
ncbi:hypothetical protein C6Y28_05930 [Megasphaera elsdenii]|uniref:Uncharacterized protein n=1 Tax=Megasphaera elsdenii TaxID=907 RepID=A0A2S0M6U6_MEGEL|nr:hypothetical protein C6Y28_05930 [Megasphaera elsdenii]